MYVYYAHCVIVTSPRRDVAGGARDRTAAPPDRTASPRPTDRRALIALSKTRMYIYRILSIPRLRFGPSVSVRTHAARWGARGRGSEGRNYSAHVPDWRRAAGSLARHTEI